MAGSPLNVFQRLTRQWDAMHPYNAAQVMRLGMNVAAADAERVWRDVLRDVGLGRPVFQGNQYRYIPLADGDAPQLQQPETSLEAHISAEMNRPFAIGDVPFRPFLMNDADTTLFGVIYHHWAADSSSIRTLLQRTLERLLDPSVSHAPLLHPTAGYWSHFGPAQAKWQLDTGFFTSLRSTSRSRQLQRVEHPDFTQFATRSKIVRVSEGTISSVVAGARRLGVTVNDVFLAAIAEVCIANRIVTPTRTRRDIALGTIVDLRQHSARRLHNTFGLFLGFENVFLRPRDFADFTSLVRAVSEQSNRQKRTRSACSSMIRMTAGLAAHHVRGPRKIAQFYRKRMPLAGGISNVNLNRTWAGQIAPEILKDFIRISPSGPMMPLVFTTTTLRDTMNFGFTWRESLLSAEVAKSCCEQFVERLKDIAGR